MERRGGRSKGVEKKGKHLCDAPTGGKGETAHSLEQSLGDGGKKGAPGQPRLGVKREEVISGSANFSKEKKKRVGGAAKHSTEENCRPFVTTKEDAPFSTPCLKKKEEDKSFAEVSMEDDESRDRALGAALFSRRQECSREKAAVSSKTP